MTAMAQALNRAGYDTANAELASIVSRAVNRYPADKAKAALEIGRALVDKRHLMRTVADILIQHFRSDADGGHEVSASHGLMKPAAENSSSNEAIPGVPKGHPTSASLLDETKLANCEGQVAVAEKAKAYVSPAREPLSLTEAGRVLRQEQLRQPGAGALRHSALATRERIRGESWLLAHALPDGPQALSLKFGDLMPMAKRLARESGERAFNAVLLRKLHSECLSRGQVAPDQIVGELLSPAQVEIVAQSMEGIMPRAKVAVRDFLRTQLQEQIDA